MKIAGDSAPFEELAQRSSLRSGL